MKKAKKIVRKTAPAHPGEVLLEDFLKPLGITPHALALALRVPPIRISQIVRGKRAITPDTALRLGQYFGTSAELWIGLQADYDLEIAARASAARIQREVLPREAEVK